MLAVERIDCGSLVMVIPPGICFYDPCRTEAILSEIAFIAESQGNICTVQSLILAIVGSNPVSCNAV